MFEKEVLKVLENYLHRGNITIRHSNGTVGLATSYGGVLMEEMGSGILLTYLDKSKKVVRCFVPSTTSVEITTESPFAILN